jgi:hypothetical protein
MFKQVIGGARTPTLPLECASVVHESCCSTCGRVNIGETERRLSERVKEHQADVQLSRTTMKLCRHIDSNPSHTINWNGIKILAVEKNPVHWQGERKLVYF